MIEFFLKDVIQVKNPIIPKEKLSNSQKRIIFARDFFIKKLNEKLNDTMLLFSLIYLLFWIIYLYCVGLVFWLLFALQCVYFVWWLWKNIFYQLNAFRLVQFIWDNPLSVIIGKLGTGKTLLLTYLSQTMKLLTDEIYSNYTLEDDKVKVLTFKNLDFTDRTKPVPPDDSVILFDESYLYIDGTSPHDEKKVHSGKIPWIVLARHFGNCALFTAQREGMIWNNIRQLASGIIIPISLKKPVIKKGFNFFNRFFIMRIGIFQDITDYEILKTKSVERTAEGKRVKHKSDVGLGIWFFKIIIPLEFANKYDSQW
ncbi:Spiroplasmavirus-related protein [Spiroplasma kunkelii CR2-3x]|uniref:Spiroplasmavirus-related protein n=1 Tax=Spiroplasma kunkelii CR2-3x TaxID=273035 RepID=A0A0K2JGN4_SPIKU|nr:Spiroplasmavirus-related protein [Spiroplasma kunkelii CR2-3x]